MPLVAALLHASGVRHVDTQCCVLLQVVHSTVQELNDITANTFTVRVIVQRVLDHINQACSYLQSWTSPFMNHMHTYSHPIY